jgi:phospholipid N-methyltransferase
MVGRGKVGRFGRPSSGDRLGGMSRLLFPREFLRAWKRVGAVAPTSRGVARRISALAGTSSASLVAELGPGTGAVTVELLADLPPTAQLWAFEIHPPFIQHLEATVRDERFRLVTESAEAIDTVRERAGLGPFDAIVSAIPFSLLAPDQTQRMLHAAARALKPDGVLVALQYHPRYLAPRLKAEFARVRRELYPWNLPPAVLLRASGPRRAR